MSAAALARVVRDHADRLQDAVSAVDEYPNRQLTRDVAELALVAARVLEGKPVLRAFGAPGDWGYGTPIGDALLAALKAQSATTPASADRLEV